MLLKKFESLEKTENGYIIHGDKADILLVFLSDEVIRIRTAFDRAFEEESYTLITTAWADRMDPLFRNERRRIKALDIPCQEETDTLTFRTSTLRLVMQKCPLAFRLYDSDGVCIYRDLPDRAFERDHLGRLSHYSCMDREQDHFYGFGETSGHLDKKLRRLRMSPKDSIGIDPEHGGPMYKHIPFYIRYSGQTRKALGLFYHNSHECVFDMGQEISGYWERYCYWQADGGDIDLFLISGPAMTDIIRRYTWLTGTTAMPTKQSLGYCASTMYYTELEKDCDQEIYKVIDKHEREEILIDNFWLASGYSSGEEDNLRYTFNWNYRRFPKPEQFFENMNARGINVIPNLKPGVLENHPYAGLYEERGAFIRTPEGDDDYRGQWWGGKGRFVDFTGETGRNTWKELLKHTILEKGTKTVWNDNCEMDSVEDRAALCSFEGKQGTMARLKVLQSNMMAYVAKQAIAEVYPGERPYIINRAGAAGIQRYAQVWGGDNLTGWKSIGFNIATILGMGLSGCANMGCDIGGFTGGAPEGELLLRWIQSGIFQPRFCLNSANTDNTVTQPWMYEENLPHVRAAYAQRYRMLPYLYSLMYQAHTTGLPVMRPLFLEFPDDAACYTDESLTFLFGSSILVANVIEPGATTRTLYLPKGAVWYDMGDYLRAYEGGQTITVPVNLSSIPIFLRGDAVYMTSEDVKHILADTMRQLDLFIGSDGNSSFVFYDDDGHTNDFERGVYERTTITVTSGERKVISFQREGDYPGTVERLTLKVISKDKGAYWVAVDGEQIPRFLVREGWEEANRGWYYNLSDRTIWVKCPRPQKDAFDIVVSTEKFDLIGMPDE